MSLWIVGLELKSGVVGGDCCGQVTLLLKSKAEVIVGFWVVGLESKSGVVRGDGCNRSPSWRATPRLL